MTCLYSGLPVSDRAGVLTWPTAFFGRPADEVLGDEALWRTSDTAWVFVDEHPERAGGALPT